VMVGRDMLPNGAPSTGQDVFPGALGGAAHAPCVHDRGSLRGLRDLLEPAGADLPPNDAASACGGVLHARKGAPYPHSNNRVSLMPLSGSS
jgi:hypothetical protein